MHSPQTASPSSAVLRKRGMEDVVYQVVTVGAILMMMGTLWIF